MIQPIGIGVVESRIRPRDKHFDNRYDENMLVGKMKTTPVTRRDGNGDCGEQKVKGKMSRKANELKVAAKLDQVL